jgi:hypothetical protein
MASEYIPTPMPVGDDTEGLRFVKSSYSDGERACMEVAADGAAGFVVRDSKNPTGPILSFTGAEWTAFLAGASDGEFDPERLAAV